MMRRQEPVVMTRREFWERKLGPSRHFGTSDVARICRASQRQVQRWIETGKLPALGGTTSRGVFKVRVGREALIEFLLDQMPEDRYPTLKQFELFF